MSECRDIQPELSAYVDSELPPSQRAEVEAHIASCPHCQQELTELQTLAAGLAMLPKLQPAPRFLAEVRRKIVRGDRPEPLTWQDYVFRPFWVKVSLGAAAMIAVVVLVMRVEQPPVSEKESAGAYQMAKAQSTDSDRDDGIGNKKVADSEPATKSEPPQAPAERTAPAASESGGQYANAPTPPAEPSPAQDSAPSSTGGEDRHTLDGLVKSGLAAPAAAGGGVGFETRRRALVTSSLQGTATPLPTPNATALAQAVGIDPAKLGGVIIVNNKSASDMRSQAEQLVARCKGTIITAPQSEDFTGQVFFVEIPEEYAATFKLEMARFSNLSATTDVALVRNESGMATGAAPAVTVSTGTISGVLTGSRNANAAAGSPHPITMDDIVGPKKPATVVLEIVIAPPKK